MLKLTFQKMLKFDFAGNDYLGGVVLLFALMLFPMAYNCFKTNLLILAFSVSVTFLGFSKALAKGKKINSLEKLETNRLVYKDLNLTFNRTFELINSFTPSIVDQVPNPPLRYYR